MAQQPLDYQTVLRAWQLQQQATGQPDTWFSADAALAEQKAQQAAAAAQQDAEAARLAEATRGRTWGEAIGDTGAAIGQAVVGTGQAAYGLANLATLGGLDRATGMSENFAETQQTLEGLKSDPYQRDKRQASAMFERGDIGGGVMQYAMNPELLGDAAIQSVPYMLGVAGLSRAAAGRAAAGLTGEAATAAASQAAVRANLAGQAGMTAGQINVDIVNQARKQGYSEEDAQMRGLAGAPVGLLTAGISKLTGAADLESKAAQAFMSGAAGSAAKNKGANVMATVLAGTARESGEELLQSGQEKIGTNLATGKPWNEGVAEAASVGALLGGVLGGGMASLTVRRDSPLRQEIAAMNQQINAPTEWTAPGGGLTDMAFDARQREAAREQAALPTAEVQDTGAPYESVAVDQLPVEDITIDQVPGLPEAGVQELTGLRAIVAQQRAQQIPRMGVEEVPLVEQQPVAALGTPLRIEGNDPKTVTYERRNDGRLNRTIRYGDGESLTEMLVTDSNGDEHWVSDIAYARGEFYPVAMDEAKASVIALADAEEIGYKKQEEQAAEVEQRPDLPMPEVGQVGADIRPVQDIIRETAPIGAVAERFGMAAAAQEAARRSQVSAPAEQPRTPVDMNVAKTAKKYRQDARAALTAAGIPNKSLTGAEFKEIVDAVAAAGVLPSDPDFMQAVAPVADRIARSKGGEAAGVSGIIATMFPVTTEQRVDAAFDAPTPPVSRTFTPEPVSDADAPVGKVSKATGAGATNRAQDLQTFVAGAGGINRRYMQDITGDVQNKRMGRGRVFTEAGTSMDDMARKAWEAGYLTDADMADGTGGEAALRDKLQRSLAGEKVVPVGTLDAQMEAAYRARVEAEQQAAAEAATDLYLEAPAVAVQAGIMAPASFSASQPYSAADSAEYAKQDAAWLLNSMIDQKAYEANPEPVLAAMVQLLSEAPNIPAYNRIASAIYAHPTMKAGRPYSFTDEQAILINSETANALGRLGEIPFHLGNTGGERTSDLERALAMTEAGIKFRTGQTETTAFKRWFGDSKVVDADGKPLVVYHGSTQDISEFDAAGEGDEVGAFFTTNPASLSEYTDGDGGNVTPVYLRITNPYEVTVDQWNSGEGLTPRAARRAGYDGYIIRGQDGGDTFIVFRPEQIKSAIGNRGTFDPANPDIRYKRGAANGVANELFDAVVANASAALGVKVQGHRTIADAERATGLRLPRNAKGFFLPNRKEVHVIQSNAESKRDLLFTIAHEQGHQGLAALLGTSLRAATARMWSNAELRRRIKAKQSELGPNATRSVAAEEVLADMLAAGERLPTSVWAKLKAGIVAFFRDILGYKDFNVTNDDVNRLLSDVAKVLKGEQPSMTRAYWQSINWLNDPEAMAEASPKFSLAKSALSEAIESAKNEPEGKVGSLWDVAKVVAGAGAEAAKNSAVSVKDGAILKWVTNNLVPLDQMSSLYDNLFGGRINKFAELKQAKDHKFNTLNAHKNTLEYTSADGKTESLGKHSTNEVSELWSTWGRKNPRKYSALNHMYTNATYFKLHPDRSWEQQKQDIDYEGAGFTIEERQAALAEIATAWATIGAEGQRLYKLSQSIYKHRWNERNDAVIAEIKRLTGMTDADLKADNAPSMLSQVKQAGKRWVEMFDAASRRIDEGPYSPLQRNGEHLVTVRDSAGNVVWFSAHETKADANIAADELVQQMDAKGETEYVVDIGTQKEYVSGMGADPRAVEALAESAVADLQAMIPADMDPAAREQLINTLTTAIYDARLQALPQNAFIKHTRARKNVAGASTDAHRAFSAYQLRSARDIANMRFDGKIASALQEIEQYVKDAGAGKFNEPGKVRVDTSKLRIVADAVKRQHEASIDVVQNKVVNALTQAAFIKFLASPSQLVLNAMQTPMVAFPRMAAKYGAGKTIKALKSAMADYARARTDLLGEKSPIDKNSKEWQVLQSLFEDGTLDITQVHDLASIANGGEAAISPYFDQAMRVMSYTMHKSEVFNRQVTALGTVRALLADPKNNNMSIADLTTEARKMVMATHYNYAQSNKPPIMQSPMRKLVTQFQLYRLHTLAMIAKDIRNAMGKSGTTDPDALKLEIKEARAALAWILLMQLTFVGAAGTILAPFVFAIMDAFKDDDDLTDSRQDAINFMGKYLAHGVFAGVWDTQRIAADQLIPFWGDKPYEPVAGTPRDVFMYHITKNLGPSVGMLGDVVVGTDHLLNGDFEKATASLMPKAFADLFTSYFNATEGVRDARDVAYYEPGPWSTMLNVVGLKSGERRDVDADRGAVYKAKARAYATKQRYLTLLAVGHSTGDADQIAEANEKINNWNAQYPDMAITAQDRKRAVVMRIRSEQIADQYGIVATRAPGATLTEVMGR